MTALDWVLLAGLCGSLLVGAWRGLVFEVMSLVGWVAAFLAAQVLAAPVAEVLPLPSLPVRAGQAVAFGLVFVVVAFVGGLLASALRRLLGAVGLRPVDRALGAFFGIGRALIIGLAVALLVALTPWRHSATWQTATGARWLSAALASVSPWLPGRLAQAASNQAPDDERRPL